jgi:hypothetical protein
MVKKLMDQMQSDEQFATALSQELTALNSGSSGNNGIAA